MSPALQAAFLETAGAPLRTCAERIRARRLRDAVEAVSHEKLDKALHDALELVAMRSGARLAALEQAVPREQIAACLARVEAAQREAAAVIVRYLASTVTLAPPAPSPRTAPEELRAVAASFALDRHIAVPLETLADDLATWQSALDSTAVRVVRHRAVTAALLRRWATRAAIVLAAGALAASAAAAFAWYRLVVGSSRARIDAALASPDPCSWETIAQGDLAHATARQLAEYEQRKPTCEQQRARQAHESSCATLAEHVESGAISEADQALAGTFAPLLRRAALRALTVEDLRTDGNGMPCADTAYAGRLWDAYARAASSDAALWSSAEHVSPHAAALLRRPGFQLTAEAADAQRQFSDGLARRAIKTGNPQELERAGKVCKVRSALGIEAGRACAALERVTRAAPNEKR